MQGLGLGLNKRNNKKSFILNKCESLDDITLFGCSGLVDTTNKMIGNSSIELTKNAVLTGYFIIDVVCVADLNTYNSLKFRFYVANNANIASISALFFTTIPFDYAINYLHFSVPVSGWNIFDIPFSTFTKNGTANWSTVKSLRLTINLLINNATEKVNLDQIEIK
jgi:hypothetical protein